MTSKTHLFPQVVLVAAGALALGACMNGNGGDARSPMEGTQQPSQQQIQSAQQELSQGEIIATGIAIDEGELALVELVRGKIDNVQVQDLVNTIERDHQRSLQEYQTLASRMQVQPEKGELARKLDQQVEDAKQRLRQAQGQELAREYVQITVDIHDQALRAIQDQLMTATDDPQLRNRLQTQADIVRQHLNQAQQLRDRMEPTA